MEKTSMDEISLVDIILACRRHLKVLLISFFTVIVVTILLVSVLPARYQFSRNIQLAGYIGASDATLAFAPILNSDFDYIQKVVLPNLSQDLDMVKLSNKVDGVVLPKGVVSISETAHSDSLDQKSLVQRHFDRFLRFLIAAQQSNLNQQKQAWQQQLTFNQQQLNQLVSVSTSGYSKYLQTASMSRGSQHLAVKPTVHGQLNHSQSDLGAAPGYAMSGDAGLQTGPIRQEMVRLQQYIGSLKSAHFVSNSRVIKSERYRVLALIMGLLFSVLLPMMLVFILELRKKVKQAILVSGAH